MSFSLSLHFLPVLSLQTSVCSTLKFYPVFWGHNEYKIVFSIYYPIDNRNANKKVGLIRAYFVYSFYNVENDEKIHLKNGETLRVKRSFYTMKDMERVSSNKVKYDSLTGKSVIQGGGGGAHEHFFERDACPRTNFNYPKK